MAGMGEATGLDWKNHQEWDGKITRNGIGEATGLGWKRYQGWNGKSHQDWDGKVTMAEMPPGSNPSTFPSKISKSFINSIILSYASASIIPWV